LELGSWEDAWRKMQGIIWWRDNGGLMKGRHPGFWADLEFDGGVMDGVHGSYALERTWLELSSHCCGNLVKEKRCAEYDLDGYKCFFY
jgi:hypothetical protein